MANSISFYFNALDSKGVTFKVDCTQTLNIPSNSSIIDWTILRYPTDYYYGGISPEVGETSLTFGENEAYYNESLSINVWGSISGSTEISHDEDGYLTLPVTFSCSGETYTEEWELNKIPQKSYLTQSPAQIGNLANCVIWSSYSQYTHDVTYTFGKLSGTVVTGVKGGTHPWTIPTEFYDELGANISSMSGTLTCVTYYQGVEIGTSSYTFIASTYVDDVPEIEVEVYDTNSETLALTGDRGILIPGYSDAYFSMSATAKNGATVASVKASNGTDYFKDVYTGTFENTYAPKYTFYATDSRGLIATSSVIMPLVDYVKPTANITDAYLDGTGELTFTISGNSFSGSFGAVTNSPLVQYRYREGSGDYGSWTTVEPNFYDKNYSCGVTLSGLDYQSSYTFQARIMDSLNLFESALTLVNSKPIFDWSDEDFNFNVPVNVNGGANINSDVAFGGRTSGLKAEDIEGSGVLYGTCSTSAGTAAKVVVCDEFPELKEGSSIRVRFNYGNTIAAPTLNVNGTGAYTIAEYGSTSALAYKWYSGEVKDFVFDGSYWIMVDGMVASTSYYGKTILTNEVSSNTGRAITPYGVQQAISECNADIASLSTELAKEASTGQLGRVLLSNTVSDNQERAITPYGVQVAVEEIEAKLAKYSYGTWVPTIGYASTLGITYTTNKGWYQKVGNVVTLGFYVVATVPTYAKSQAYHFYIASDANLYNVLTPAYNVYGGGILLPSKDISTLPACSSWAAQPDSGANRIMFYPVDGSLGELGTKLPMSNTDSSYTLIASGTICYTTG